jgi:hypothetical protein
MHILRVSVLAMFAMMLIVGGATFSNVFTSAVQAAPHVGKAKAGRAMPLAGVTPPDLSITGVQNLGTGTGVATVTPATETFTVSNSASAGPANSDATTPNFVQVNIQVSGLFGLTLNTAGAIVNGTPTASGTNWNCGTASSAKSISLTVVGTTTVSVPATYSFVCNYTGAFPINPGTSLPPITVTGPATGLLATLLTFLTTTPLPASAQVVTLYDTMTGNNNFGPSTTLLVGAASEELFAELASFNFPTVGLSKTVLTGPGPYAPGQNVSYRLQPTLNVSPALLFALFLGSTAAGNITLFIDDYLPPGQTFTSFTSAPSVGLGSWTCTALSNPLNTNSDTTDVQCTLPTSAFSILSFLHAGSPFSTTPLAVGLPSVDITGKFTSAAQALDYAPNYTNTADFYVLDPPGGVSQLAGVVTDANVMTTEPTPTPSPTTTPTPGGAAVSLSKTGSISGNTVTYTLTPTAVFTTLEPCDKIDSCEHILPIYASGFCTRLTRESHVQR